MGIKVFKLIHLIINSVLNIYNNSKKSIQYDSNFQYYVEQRNYPVIPRELELKLPHFRGQKGLKLLQLGDMQVADTPVVGTPVVGTPVAGKQVADMQVADMQVVDM